MTPFVLRIADENVDLPRPDARDAVASANSQVAISAFDLQPTSTRTVGSMEHGAGDDLPFFTVMTALEVRGAFGGVAARADAGRSLSVSLSSVESSTPAPARFEQPLELGSVRAFQPARSPPGSPKRCLFGDAFAIHEQNLAPELGVGARDAYEIAQSGSRELESLVTREPSTVRECDDVRHVRERGRNGVVLLGRLPNRESTETLPEFLNPVHHITGLAAGERQDARRAGEEVRAGGGKSHRMAARHGMGSYDLFGARQMPARQVRHGRFDAREVREQGLGPQMRRETLHGVGHLLDRHGQHQQVSPSAAGRQRD
jgi:hypothetical protein